MVMIKSLFLAGLMFVLAKSQTLDKPLMATLHVQSNFDFSLTQKEFRVHYSGLGNGFAHQSGEPVTIKIYKQTGEEFHTYTVDEEKKDQKKAYYFALNNADDGVYQVEVCSGSKCSGKTPALTPIASNSEHKLTCVRGSKKMEGEYETWSTTSEISLDFNGPVRSDWINTSDFETIEAELNGALQAAGVTKKYRTDFKKHGLEANPTYNHKKKIFYAAIKYNVEQYKQLFDKSTGATETRQEYAHDFCKRKYLLSAHAHIVNKSTKEVEHRFKTTLQLSGIGKQYYILSPQAAGRKVHVEMTHENANINAGTYELHIIFCATEKDAVDSTFCAEPVIYDNFEVTHDEE